MASSSTAGSPENVAFIAAIARPGDTVLIGFAEQLDDDDIEALDESFEPLRQTGVQIGFTDNVTSMVVIRPGDAVARGFTAGALNPDEEAFELRAASDADLEKEFPNG